MFFREDPLIRSSRSRLHASTRAALPLALAALLSCGGGGGSGGTGPPVDDDPTDGSAFIGTGGGFVSIGSQIRVDVPAGALTGGVTLTIEAVPTPADLLAEGAIGQAYRVRPANLVLQQALRIEIAVPAAVRTGLPLSALGLRRSTLAAGALAPAGEGLGNVQPTGNGVSGQSGSTGTFSATAPNRDPTADAGGDRSVVVGDRVNLDGSGSSDPDGDALTFSWTVEAPDGSTVTVENANGASASFVALMVGEYRATLTVTDGEGGSDTSTAVITSEANERPTADAGSDRSVAVGTQVQLDGTGSSDPNGDPLTFQWMVTAPDGSTVAVANATQAMASFLADQVGEYDVTLTVDDGRGLVDEDTITVTVTQPNRAPTVDAGNDRRVEVGTTVQLDATATDPDGDALTFSWTVTAPDGSTVAVMNPNQSLASFVAGQVGTYTATVTVADGNGGTASDTVEIEVQTMVANRAPIADAGDDREVPEDQDVMLDGTGSSDPDGDPLTLTWVQTGGPDVVLDDPMSATPSFTPPAEGDYTFQLTVSDGEFESQDTVTITVANQPPVVTVTGPALVVTGASVQVSAFATDPDGDAVTFAWTITGPGGVVPPDGPADGTTVTFTPTAFGTHTITVTVSDGEHMVDATHTTEVNLAVAGTYTATFATTNVGGGDTCESLIPTGATSDDLVVEQPDPGTVILRLSDLTDFIANDPVGTLEGNMFSFAGIITVTDGDNSVDAQGTITGTFTAGPPPGIDLEFGFTALICTVEGTITAP